MKSSSESQSGRTGDSTQFSAIDSQSKPDFFITFADAANSLDDIQAIKQLMLSLLDLGGGKRVLDVGCGTGDDARKLAELVGGRGQVVGLDHSAVMIAEAKRRQARAGLPVQFIEGDAEHLTFADATFDACRAERVLMHLARPEHALMEMARVARSGGRVVVFDFDWDTIFIDSRYKETTRKIARMYSDTIRSGWLGRTLPRLFHEAGLYEVTSVPRAVRPHYASAHDVFDGLIAKGISQGVLSGEEVTLWWQDLEQANNRGMFHFGFLGFVVAGRKP
jgi:ubiquinone/menaquinone biosynthesis C-methylase UbiE